MFAVVGQNHVQNSGIDFGDCLGYHTAGIPVCPLPHDPISAREVKLVAKLIALKV